MLDNELQIELLTEDSELRLLYDSKNARYSPPSFKGAKSFNDLALSFLCNVIPIYDDRHFKYPESIVEFADIDIDKISTVRELCAMAAYNSILKFILSPDINLRNISSYYQRFIKNIELTEENVKMSTDIYVSMMGVINKMADMWESFDYILACESTFRSYGRNPRITYKTNIDLFYLDKDGKTGCFLITPNFRAWTTIGDTCNIRNMHIAKYFHEIGIKLGKITEIRIPFSKGHTVSTYEIPIDRRILSAANRLFDNDYTLHSNPAMCTICPYYDKCSSINLRKF